MESNDEYPVVFGSQRYARCLCVYLASQQRPDFTPRMAATTSGTTPRLSDRYTDVSGPVVLNGMQALVRVLLEQRRLDAERRHNTALFVSGYEGSPLGGLDLELELSLIHI